MAKAVKRVVYRKKAALKATKAALKAGWRMEDGRTDGRAKLSYPIKSL